MRTWRKIAAPIIAAVIYEVGKDDMKRTRKALREAYPFGERKYWPYKIWCDEVRIQLGLKPAKLDGTQLMWSDLYRKPAKLTNEVLDDSTASDKVLQ